MLSLIQPHKLFPMSSCQRSPENMRTPLIYSNSWQQQQQQQQRATAHSPQAGSRAAPEFSQRCSSVGRECTRVLTLRVVAHSGTIQDQQWCQQLQNQYSSTACFAVLAVAGDGQEASCTFCGLWGTMPAYKIFSRPGGNQHVTVVPDGPC